MLTDLFCDLDITWIIIIVLILLLLFGDGEDDCDGGFLGGIGDIFEGNAIIIILLLVLLFADI